MEAGELRAIAARLWSRSAAASEALRDNAAAAAAASRKQTEEMSAWLRRLSPANDNDGNGDDSRPSIDS